MEKLFILSFVLQYAPWEWWSCSFSWNTEFSLGPVQILHHYIHTYFLSIFVPVLWFVYCFQCQSDCLNQCIQFAQNDGHRIRTNITWYIWQSILSFLFACSFPDDWNKWCRCILRIQGKHVEILFHHDSQEIQNNIIILYSNNISETYLIRLSASNMTRGKWDRTAKLFYTA